MKREYMPKGPPFSPEEIEVLVAGAPEHVDDPDCSYDPNDEAEVNAYWAKAKLVLPNAHRAKQHLKKTVIKK